MISIDFRTEEMEGKYARDMGALREGLRVEFFGFNNKEDLRKFTLEKSEQIKKADFVGRYSVDTRALTYIIMRYKRRK
jgi:hypothetical protein